MTRIQNTLRCPVDGRAVARLEVENDGSQWLTIVGGKRADTARERDNYWLGSVPEVIPDGARPFGLIPRKRIKLPSSPPSGSHPSWYEPIVQENYKVAVMVTKGLPGDAYGGAPCPRCHTVYQVDLSVSASGLWSAVLELPA